MEFEASSLGKDVHFHLHALSDSKTAFSQTEIHSETKPCI